MVASTTTNSLTPRGAGKKNTMERGFFTAFNMRNLRTQSSATSAEESMEPDESKDEEEDEHMPRPIMMPIVFGRPDLLAEIDAIGLARPNSDIYIYACCNSVLVKELRVITQACNGRAQKHCVA